MKKYLMVILIMMILCGCNPKEENPDEQDDDKSEEVIDTTSPLFLDAQGGMLPTLKLVVGESVDLLSGVRVVDDSGETVEITIKNPELLNLSVPGNYEAIYEAKDKSGNITTVTRGIVVQRMVTIEYDAIVINGNGAEYVLNSDTALVYTSSGAKFRMSDQIQVMEKDYFISEYNKHKSAYDNNGGEIFFPYGALVLVDLDGTFKLLRAASTSFEVDQLGKISTTAFSTTPGVTGEGIFKGIITKINDLLPNGGYVIFAPNRDLNKGKNFILRNLYNKDFEGGSVTKGGYNMDNTNSKIELIDGFKEEVIDNNVSTEVMGKVNKTEYIYDGIPLATYNYGDGNKKPVIFFFHGFSGNHTTGIMDKGDELAKRGFFVIAMDAYLHGGRAPQSILEQNYGQRQKEIVNIQIQTAKDAIHIYNKYFRNDERVLSGEVFAFGVSMGAGSAFYLATIMEEVKAIASIVGSPSFYEFYQEKQIFYSWEKDEYYNINLEYYKQVDPLINSEKLKDVYIYMGNGSKDTTVPKKFAEALTKKLDPSMYIYEVYDVAHTSTSEMLNNAYNYLVEHK